MLLPIEFQIHTFKLAVDLVVELSEAQIERIMQLNQLYEMRQAAIEEKKLVQQQRAQWHENSLRSGSLR